MYLNYLKNKKYIGWVCTILIIFFDNLIFNLKNILGFIFLDYWKYFVCLSVCVCMYVCVCVYVDI